MVREPMSESACSSFAKNAGDGEMVSAWRLSARLVYPLNLVRAASCDAYSPSPALRETLIFGDVFLNPYRPPRRKDT